VAPSMVIDSPMAPSRVIEAISVVFLPRFLGILPRRLVFVDESGFHTSMTRLRARAPKGERAYASKWEASHRHRPLTSSSRSEATCDFFDRPGSLWQALDGPAHRGGRDQYACVLFEGLAMLL
jgi:hypothetical protein